ncbi:MAG: NADH-quinone oxidoreductase subunit N [Planctomycetaceae bacterium]|nr:NADH-quinone oxidoreductase subunit N [Planctomycetaceae bacterium]
MTTATLRLLMPEIVLVAVAVAIYLAGAFWNGRRAWSWIAGAALLASAAILWAQTSETDAGGPLRIDALAWFTRWLALGLGALLALLSSRPLTAGGTSEYVGSLLLTVAGLMLVASAADLVLLFVALELISIPTYLLLYLGRSDVARRESAAKYFFLSVLSSAILLYGFSFLCGVAGFARSAGTPHAITEFAAVHAALDGASGAGQGIALTAFAKLAMVLVFAGLSFRVTAVPFHFYAPDVYQGTTHPNAALLSLVPKAAGLVAMVRILVDAMPAMAPHAWQMVLVVSLLTMTVANVMALWQDDFRRLLAYSSISQAGYMLLALAVALAGGRESGEWDGLATLWFYVVVYALATLGAFAIAEHLGGPNRRVDGIDELAGLGRTRPMAGAMMAVCMLSLTGVPPLAGFWGKLLVFGGALNTGAGVVGQIVNLPSQVNNLPHGTQWWFIAAAVIGVLNAAVAAAYYLRVVAMLYFRTPSTTLRPEGGRGPWFAAVLCTLLLIAAGVYPGPLLRTTTEAAGGPRESTAQEATASMPSIFLDHL